MSKNPSTKVKIFYTLSDNQDGSFSVSFHVDEEAAQLACDIQDEGGQSPSENWPRSVELEFDVKGKLLNPSSTKEELRKELAELRGEEVAEEESLPEKFQQAAQLPSTGSFSGKTVVFTGTFSTVTREEAINIVTVLGARVVGSVSKNTDYLVVGKDAGSAKLEKAASLGVTIISEETWDEMRGAKPAAKPPGPKP